MTYLLPRNFFNADDSLLSSSIALKKLNIDIGYYGRLFEEYEKLYRKKTGIKNIENVKDHNSEHKELQKKQILNQPVKSSLAQSIDDKKYKTK